MTSTKKVAANRANAKRSTGPKTVEGKAVSKLNALQDGPLTKAVLMAGESKAELVGFARNLRASLAPVGDMELLLAERVITCAWRLRRLLKIETALFEKKSYGSDDPAMAAFAHAGREKMTTFSNYEANIERSMIRAMRELERLQDARRGKGRRLPPLLDVTPEEFRQQYAHAREEAPSLPPVEVALMAGNDGMGSIEINTPVYAGNERG